MNYNETNHPALIEFLKDNKGYSPETVESYSSTVQNFITFTDKEIHEIRGPDVSAWMHHLKNIGQKKSNKSRSINQRYSALNTFFKYCVDEGLTENNPCLLIDKLKVAKLLPKPMSELALFKLREAAKSSKRDRAIIETLYTTGVRVAELVNIRIEDINLEDHEIFIREGKGCSKRFVLFSFTCGIRIQEYIGERKTGPLYLNAHKRAFTSRGIYWLIKQYVKTSGVDSRISPHTFRHSFATFLADKGVPFEDIAELLGHNGLKNVKVYAKLSKEVRKRLYDEFLNN